MFSKFLYFLILFSATAFVLCIPRVPCELTDEACVTKDANNHFRRIASGLPDHGVPSSDPIHVDLIEATFPTLNYTLSDAHFHGMKDCHVDELNFDFKQMTTNLCLICPRLTMESNYYCEGAIDSISLEGKGKCKVVHDDYYIGLRMNVENVKGADGKLYLKIKSFVLNPLEVRGGVDYKFENLHYGDKDKSEATHQATNKNWKKVSVATQEPAMKAFMGKFIEHLNQYFKTVSINEMFYKDV